MLFRSEEINAAGGVKVGGKSYKIEYIVEDGASDWPTFAEKSKKLIDQDGVPVVFGGWTSASRKAMLPVYESKDAFLYYPIQYEAQECSNNIFYTGATPNQQSEPATDFMYKRSPAAGGVKVGGKSYKIEYIVEDGASDWPTFAEKSKKLIDQDGVPVVFGGWTSASRKAMLPVYESKDAFLYYPIQYEAQECSNNIFYTGATPNQQSEPATDFMYKRSPAAGGDFFLVGSDYVFPRTSNTITKAQVKQLGGNVVGEDYLPLGNTEVAPIISKKIGRAHV